MGGRAQGAVTTSTAGTYRFHGPTRRASVEASPMRRLRLVRGLCDPGPRVLFGINRAPSSDQRQCFLHGGFALSRCEKGPRGGKALNGVLFLFCCHRFLDPCRVTSCHVMSVTLVSPKPQIRVSFFQELQLHCQALGKGHVVYRHAYALATAR